MSQDLFLQLDGIEGESTDFLHMGWIEALSFSLGAKQRGLSEAEGAARGKASFTHVTITKHSDISSPPLLLCLAQNALLKTAVLESCQAADEKHVFTRITLSDVTIASFQMGQDEEKGVPLESLELNYASIEFEYIPLNVKGKTQAKRMMQWYIRSQK